MRAASPRQLALALRDLEAGRYTATRCAAPAPAERPIQHPQGIYDLLAPEMAPLPQERLAVLLLTSKHVVCDRVFVYQGTVSGTDVRIAEVLRYPVIAGVPKIAIAHNHPSGDPSPSEQDEALTRDLQQACELLGIRLLDHVVIGSGGRWVSLREKGVIR